MPAKITVLSGVSAGAEYWIADDVLRIGSDASCEFRTADPGLPPRTATLEYRPGAGYLVHNKTAGGLSMAGAAVGPGASAAWQPGTDLHLPGGLALRLDIQGDPAPGPAPAAVAVAPEPAPVAVTDSADPGAGAEPDPKEKKGGVGQIVMVLLLLGVLAFVLLDPGPSKTPTETGGGPEAATFETVLKDLSDPKTAGADNKTIIGHLQQARSAEARGDAAAAREGYIKTRDALWLRRNKADGTFPAKPDQQTWDFLRAKLEALAQ